MHLLSSTTPNSRRLDAWNHLWAGRGLAQCGLVALIHPFGVSYRRRRSSDHRRPVFRFVLLLGPLVLSYSFPPCYARISSGSCTLVAFSL